MTRSYEELAGSGGGEGGGRFHAFPKALAGTLGILVALLVDYIQKGDNSALLFGTRLINTAALANFQIQSVPPFVYALALMAAGFALVYIFEPSNKRNAFYAGAGVLGVLATMAPVAQQAAQYTPIDPSLMQELQSTPQPTQGSWNFAPGGHVMHAAFQRPAPLGSNTLRVADGDMRILVIIRFPSDQGTNLPRVSAWLHDGITNKKIALTSGQVGQMPGGPILVFRTGIATGPPLGNTAAKLAVRVEAPGYQIASQNKIVRTGARQPVRINVALRRSNVPLAVQRLRYPYSW
jgi:hypothetical protein